MIQQLIGMLDLTTLDDLDTPDKVASLAARAEAHGVAAVCVYPAMIEFAQGDVPVATVAGGFPHGLVRIETLGAEVWQVIEAGADEVDIVIPRHLVFDRDEEGLSDWVEAAVEACDERALLKVILSTGQLESDEAIYWASRVCLDSGADFIKTSTGKESVNATPEAAASMIRAIKDHGAGGFKAAGGIKTLEQAQVYLQLFETEIGPADSSRLRIGASSLLDDLLSRLPQVH